jgi:hypothetical protein
MGSLENVWASFCLDHRAHFPFLLSPQSRTPALMERIKRNFLVRTVGAAVSRVCQLEADFDYFALLYPWLSEVRARVYSHEMDHWLWIRYLGDQG